jgi:hypothetical protein
MNARKKHLGTGAQIRAMKERRRRIALAVTISLLVIAILVSGFVFYTRYYSSSEDGLPKPTLQFRPESLTSEAKAAIIDHLSLTAPNETFTQTVASILTKANYAVDYYSGEKVTVDFYRNLPTGGYKLLILRVHSAPVIEGDTEGEAVNLFTSEPYSTSSHVSEQLNKEVVIAEYQEGSAQYFGIAPSFIRNRMKGTFNNATVIMMGCDGLKHANTAQAFAEKGAKVYIGWNGLVSASHTDTATTRLLNHLVTENLTIKESIDQTFKEIGLDPSYFSQLAYYPLAAGEQGIGDVKNRK